LVLVQFCWEIAVFGRPQNAWNVVETQMLAMVAQRSLMLSDTQKQHIWHTSVSQVVMNFIPLSS
jgi:hypothetical protein